MSEHPGHIPDQAINMTVINKTVTVTVHRLLDTPIAGLPNYYVVTDTPVLHVGDPTTFTPELIKITWKLVAGEHVEPQISFPTPAVIFADPMSPFLVSRTSGDTCEGFWSNMEQKNRGAFPYTIYVKVGDDTVLHDPTVENQPPF
ncbi:MAG TPA: hypothetical protein VGF28_17130 [Thermoanaerobaculia bacterium]|jgi:hypothetical protein